MKLRKYIQLSEPKAVVPFEEKDDAELLMKQLAERWFEGMLFLEGFPRPTGPKFQILPLTEELKAEIAMMFERNLARFIQNYFFPQIKKPNQIQEVRDWLLANASKLISQRSFISSSKNPKELFILSIAETLGSRQFTKTIPDENFKLSTSQKFLYLQENQEVTGEEWEKEDQLYTLIETFDLDATLINTPPYSPGKLNPELLTKLYWCEANGIDYVVNTNRILQKSLEKMLTALEQDQNVEEETFDYALRCIKNHGLRLRVCTPGDPHTDSKLEYYDLICTNERYVLQRLNEIPNKEEKIRWLQNILHQNSDSEFKASTDEEQKLIKVLATEKNWKEKPGEGWKQPQALWISKLVSADHKTVTAHFDDDYKNIDGMHTDLLLAPQFIPGLVVRKNKDDSLTIDGFEQISRLDGMNQFSNEDYMVRFIEINQRELKHSPVDETEKLKELAAIQYFIQMNPAHPKLPDLLKAFYKNLYKLLNKEQQDSFNELVLVKVLKLFDFNSRQTFLKKGKVESNISKSVAKICLMKPSKTLSSSLSGSNLRSRPKIVLRSASLRDSRVKLKPKSSSRAEVPFSSKTKLTDILHLPKKPYLKDFKDERYGRSFQRSQLGDKFKKLLENKNLTPKSDLKIHVMSEEYNQIKTTINQFNSFENLMNGLPVIFDNSTEWVNTLAQIYQMAFNYLNENISSPELSGYFSDNGNNLLEHALSMHSEERLQAAMLTSVLEIVSENLTQLPKVYAEILMKVIQRQNIIIMNCRDALDNLIREEVSKDPKIVKGLHELYNPIVTPHVERIYDEINKYLITLLKDPKKYKQIPFLHQILLKIKECANKSDIESLMKINLNTIATECRLESLGVQKEKTSNEVNIESKEQERLGSQQLKSILSSDSITSSTTQRVQPKYIKPAIASAASTVVGGAGVTYNLLTVGTLIAAQQAIPVWGQIVAAIFLTVGIVSLITTGVLKLLSWNSERKRKNSEKAVQSVVMGQNNQTPNHKKSLSRNASMSQKLGVQQAPEDRTLPSAAFSTKPVMVQADDPSHIASLEEGYIASVFHRRRV